MSTLIASSSSLTGDDACGRHKTVGAQEKRMDTEKKSTSSLFLLRHARKDPKNRLLAELLADFPTAEQIARLTEALRNSWDPDEEWGKNALAFLQVLKELFGADEPSYRAHLRNLYGAIED